MRGISQFVENIIMENFDISQEITILIYFVEKSFNFMHKTWEFQ